MHSIVRIAFIGSLILKLNFFIESVRCVCVFQILRIDFRLSVESLLGKLIIRGILGLIILIELIFVL